MSCLAEVIAKLEKIAPLENQAEWDNSGLLFAGDGREIKRVMATLDLTPDAAAEAIDRGADLIVEHHPSIFSSVKTLCGDDPNISAFAKVAAQGIAVYAMHTSFDFAEGGLNDDVIAKFGLRDIHAINGVPANPRMGILKNPVTLEKLAEICGELFGDPFVRFIGDGEKVIEKIAVVNGGGASSEFLRLAKEAGADVFITGDVKYHLARWTRDANYAMIIVGHYESEKGFAELVCKKAAEEIKDATFFVSEKCCNPYS